MVDEDRPSKIGDDLPEPRLVSYHHAIDVGVFTYMLDDSSLVFAHGPVGGTSSHL